MTQKEILESLKNKQTQTTQPGKAELMEVIRAMESIAISMETLSSTAVQRVQTAEEEAERHIEALERRLQKWSAHIAAQLQATADTTTALREVLQEAARVSSQWRWRTWGWVVMTVVSMASTFLLLGVLLRWRGVQSFLMKVLLTVN